MLNNRYRITLGGEFYSLNSKRILSTPRLGSTFWRTLTDGSTVCAAALKACQCTSTNVASRP